MKRERTILVVDDDSVGLKVVTKFLAVSGYQVAEAGSCAAAQRAFRVRPHAAVLDYKLPDGDALDLLAKLHEADPQLPVVILTAHASIELAVEAMHLGAEHFLTKPVDLEALATVLGRCLASGRDRRRRVAGDTRRDRQRPDPFLGSSAAIRRLGKKAGKIAQTGKPVLLTGETGSGKGVLARWIHDHGPRASEPFIDLNCAGLKADLLENELFGHDRGAFTGAHEAKQGLFEVADRGTLFLDEVGDLDLTIQPRLLKVLEEQSFRHLGAVRERRVDVRLIAATHRDLSQQVRRQEFRQDLYFRLNTFMLEIPPLRKRWEDIPLLAEHFFVRLGQELGRPGLALSNDALEALVRHPWPGNIRELRNVLEHAVLFSEGRTVKRGDLPFEVPVGDSSASITPDFSLEDMEKQHIRRVLKKKRGSVTQAIKTLRIPRSSLFKEMKKYGIERQK